MPKIIGGLWDEFYKKVYGEITTKRINNQSVCIISIKPNGELYRFICAGGDDANQNYEC